MLYFLKYYNVKLHINTKYFGETLEGTGQAEDYRKLSPKKPTIRSIVKIKKVNEFVKTHLLAISLGFMSQTLYIIHFSFLPVSRSIVLSILKCSIWYTL